MELKNVKLVGKLDVENGTTKAGKPWKKQTIIVEETDSQYPKSVAITVWNDMVDKVSERAIGDHINCAIRIESREYNGRWYTDVSSYAIHRSGETSSNSVPAETTKTPKKTAPPNDLPF